ncbi:MAG: branched-chain amino acid transporter permease, partial [Phycisphaerales bacterium]|nr:branched-chain amino acid transporter permease [Phycisphaerales bacterium]
MPPAPADVSPADAPGGSPAPAGPGGTGTPVDPVGPASSVAFATASPTGRLASLLANGPVPLVLLALVGLGWFVERSGNVDPYDQRVVTLIGFNIVLAVGLQLINGFSGQFSLGHAGFMAVGAYLAAYPAKVHAHLGSTPAAMRVIDHPFGVLAFYVSLGVALAAGAGLVFGLLWALRGTRRLHAQAPALLMLAGLAWIVWDLAQASKYADVAAYPAHLVWARAAAFLTAGYDKAMAAAGPAAAWLSAALPAGLRGPACYVVLLLGGGAFAAAAGFVVGIPTLRLRGDYLAIATLGLAEIIRIAIQNSAPFGGALGLTSIPKYTDFAWLYGVALVAALAVWRLAYSARGRLIMAVREDEIAASAVGVDPTRQKVLAFVVGAFIGGVAGALFAMNERSITPGYFGLDKSIAVVAIVTLGGLGSISGAVLAAVVLTLLPERLRAFAEYRMILYALLLVAMMLFRPKGLLGGVELWPRRRHALPAARPADEP